jgi:hypothetical protein
VRRASEADGEDEERERNAGGVVGSGARGNMAMGKELRRSNQVVCGENLQRGEIEELRREILCGDWRNPILHIVESSLFILWVACTDNNPEPDNIIYSLQLKIHGPVDFVYYQFKLPVKKIVIY